MTIKQQKLAHSFAGHSVLALLLAACGSGGGGGGTGPKTGSEPTFVLDPKGGGHLPSVPRKRMLL